MNGIQRVKQFDEIKEFTPVLQSLYNIPYETSILLSKICINKGYSLKYLKEGIYKKSIEKLIKELQ